MYNSLVVFVIREAIYKAAKQTKSEVGVVSILVNNAGIVNGTALLDTSDERIIRTFDVNIMAHFWTIKAFLPDMISQKRGHLVNVASLAGHSGTNKLVDYCASKFAAVGLDESLRVELFVQGHGDTVRTTVICPYYINTGMFAGVQVASIKHYTFTKTIRVMGCNGPMMVIDH